MRPYNPNRLAHAPEPDEEAARRLLEQQADEALLRQWAQEEKQAKANNRHADREVLREIEKEVRHIEALTVTRRIILLEPELVACVNDVFTKTERHRKRRNIMRRVRSWTKDALVSLEMMKEAIKWLRDFDLYSYPCMGCGVELGIHNAGTGRVPFEIVIVTPEITVGGLCRNCFELDYKERQRKIIARIDSDAGRKDQERHKARPEGF